MLNPYFRPHRQIKTIVFGVSFCHNMNEKPILRDNVKFVEEKSAKWNEESPLKLMNRWRHVFNLVMLKERPGTKIVKRFKKADEEFKKIFAAANIIRLSTASNQESSAATSNDGFISDTSSLSSTEEEYSNDSDSETVTSFNMSKVLQEELLKLNKSKCINLMSDNYHHYYKSSFSNEFYSNMMEKCVELKTAHEAGLEVSTKQVIDNVFEQLMAFRFDNNTDNIIKYIDSKKSCITDKHSEEYKLFFIIELIVKSFKAYKNENNLSESTYLRKFEMIVEALFEDAGLVIKDGESVCSSTQKMQIMNQAEIDFGRRIDLLVVAEGDEEYELCSVEFKKFNVDNSTMIKQQSKNARINCCILNEMHLINNSTDANITYMDFAGRSGYVVQLFKYNSYYVIHKIGDIYIPKSLIELHIFKNTVYNLFLWMKSLIRNRNVVATSHANQNATFNMLDIASSCIPSVFQTPPRRQVRPERVFLSPPPSNRTKRTRTAYEEDKNF